MLLNSLLILAILFQILVAKHWKLSKVTVNIQRRLEKKSGAITQILLNQSFRNFVMLRAFSLFPLNNYENLRYQIIRFLFAWYPNQYTNSFKTQPSRMSSQMAFTNKYPENRVSNFQKLFLFNLTLICMDKT